MMTSLAPARRRADLELVGADRAVPLVTGGTRRYVNLDYAASAPCLVAVKRAMADLLDWYASVHRGAGFLSDICTHAYEGARTAVGEFVVVSNVAVSWTCTADGRPRTSANRRR